ncbi:MAG: hypothetical protein N3A62_10710 [Thermodesulfovibrionales bacterium]|nr:hypothetical protein [Thermodesulfovibrionales bacterium]
MRYLTYLHKILLCAVTISLLISCATRQLAMPDVKDVNLETLFSELSRIKGVEASIEIEFDKGDAVINGDMFLKADDTNLTIRLYYLGFPAGEITEKDGEIKNTMKISKRKAHMIAQGLKRSLFWWKNPFTQVIDNPDSYTLIGNDLVVSIDKKTLLPRTQTVRLPDGEVVDITYLEPKQVEPEQKTGGITDWYQSSVILSYQNYKASTRINSLTIFRE